MKITNSLGLPQPFVSAATREYSYTPKRYSVTALLKGVRESILQRRHDAEIEQDVADMAWLIFGTAVHSVLEAAQETDTQLKENKIVVPLPNGYELSGIFDLYDDATGTVTDYKTGTVWKVVYDDWADYRKQTLLYCWMLRQIGFDAHAGEMVMLLKDHSKTKAAIDPSYPQYPIFVKRWEFSDSEIGEAGEWIESRFLELEAAEALPDDELPLCTPDERWAKPSKWAVTKKGNKRAAKLHDTEADAIADAERRAANEGKEYTVEHRPGEDGKCLKYCSAKEFCGHYLDLIGDDGE